MGLTYVTADVHPLDRSGPGYHAQFLVDTGAIDCLAPARELEKAGVTEEGKKVYEMADGSVIELPYGFARVSFFGSETVVQITFGPDDAEPILGVVALENTGVVVDPVKQVLKRLSAIPLKKLPPGNSCRSGFMPS